jgi:hypothetical protein
MGGEIEGFPAGHKLLGTHDFQLSTEAFQEFAVCLTVFGPFSHGFLRLHAGSATKQPMARP